jgi:hypothetical protein
MNRDDPNSYEDLEVIVRVNEDAARLAKAEKALFLPDGSRNSSHQVRSEYETTYEDCMEYLWSAFPQFANVKYIDPEHSVGDFLRAFQNDDHIVYKDGTHWISVGDLRGQIAHYHRKVSDKLNIWSRDVRHLGYRALTPDDDIAMLALNEAKQATRRRIESAIKSKRPRYHSQEERLKFAHRRPTSSGSVAGSLLGRLKAAKK